MVKCHHGNPNQAQPQSSGPCARPLTAPGACSQRAQVQQAAFAHCAATQGTATNTAATNTAETRTTSPRTASPRATAQRARCSTPARQHQRRAHLQADD